MKQWGVVLKAGQWRIAKKGRVGKSSHHFLYVPGERDPEQSMGGSYNR
jgi:hypothetical protein